MEKKIIKGFREINEVFERENYLRKVKFVNVNRKYLETKRSGIGREGGERIGGIWGNLEREGERGEWQKYPQSNRDNDRNQRAKWGDKISPYCAFYV